MTDNVTMSRIVRKQQCYASVTRACRQCGAPGFWHDTPGVNVGCYAPEKVTKLGENPVGEICPQCGAARVAIEPHGLLWQRVWRVTIWSIIKEYLQELFTKPRKENL